MCRDICPDCGRWLSPYHECPPPEDIEPQYEWLRELGFDLPAPCKAPRPRRRADRDGGRGGQGG